MDVGNLASACRHVVVESKREQGGPKKTWSQLMSNDLRRIKSILNLPKTVDCGEEPLQVPVQLMLAWKRTQNDDDDDLEKTFDRVPKKVIEWALR